jgi:hypothetical protein
MFHDMFGTVCLFAHIFYDMSVFTGPTTGVHGMFGFRVSGFRYYAYIAAFTICFRFLVSSQVKSSVLSIPLNSVMSVTNHGMFHGMFVY